MSWQRNGGRRGPKRNVDGPLNLWIDAAAGLDAALVGSLECRIAAERIVMFCLETVAPVVFAGVDDGVSRRTEALSD